MFNKITANPSLLLTWKTAQPDKNKSLHHKQHLEPPGHKSPSQRQSAGPGGSSARHLLLFSHSSAVLGLGSNEHKGHKVGCVCLCLFFYPANLWHQLFPLLTEPFVKSDGLSVLGSTWRHASPGGDTTFLWRPVFMKQQDVWSKTLKKKKFFTLIKAAVGLKWIY